MEQNAEQQTRCGFVALIGAPNAGKSTITNNFVGSKVSIVSPKVQTRRRMVRGIGVYEQTQIIFIDTPGIFKPKRRLDRAMVSSAWSGVKDADIVVLVVDAKSAAYSMAPLLSGFIHFRPDIRIAGVIFNRVGSPRHYEMLREVCAEIGITCLGYLPKEKVLEQESRYLGLDFSRSKGTDAIGILTRLLEQCVDWKLLLAKTAVPLRETRERDREFVGGRKPGNLRILVARNEESFSFIYEEHLEMLREMGRISFFDPEKDVPIAQDTDLLYLPGGYPEKHSVTLAGARQVKESVREYIERGGKTLAECGGMIYLSYAIGYDKREHESGGSGFDRMAGVFPFYISNESEYRKLTLGYRSFDYKGQRLRGHEFHYTQFGKSGTAPDDSKKELYMPPTVVQVYNAKGQPVNTPVFRYKNTIASYTHLYWGETDIMRLFE